MVVRVAHFPSRAAPIAGDRAGEAVSIALKPHPGGHGRGRSRSGRGAAARRRATLETGAFGGDNHAGFGRAGLGVGTDHHAGLGPRIGTIHRGQVRHNLPIPFQRLIDKVPGIGRGPEIGSAPFESKGSVRETRFARPQHPAEVFANPGRRHGFRLGGFATSAESWRNPPDRKPANRHG